MKSFSVTHIHSHSLTQAHNQARTHSHTHTLTHTKTKTHSNLLTYTHSHTHTLKHTYTQTLKDTYTHTRTHNHKRLISLLWSSSFTHCPLCAVSIRFLNLDWIFLFDIRTYHFHRIFFRFFGSRFPKYYFINFHINRAGLKILFFHCETNQYIDYPNFWSLVGTTFKYLNTNCHGFRLKMIIFESLLTTFGLCVIFLRQLGQ